MRDGWRAPPITCTVTSYKGGLKASMQTHEWELLSPKQKEAVIHRRVFDVDLAGSDQPWRPGDAHAHIPHYVRSIAAAWKVVDRLCELAPAVSEALRPGEKQFHLVLAGDGGTHYHCQVSCGQWSGEAEASGPHAAAEAICLAALRAVASGRNGQTKGAT